MNRLTASLAAGLLLMAPALASDEKKQETEKAKVDKEEVLSFSNADLDRRYGDGEKKKSTESSTESSTAGKKPDDAGPSALEKLLADETARKARVVTVTEAEAAVVAARERIAQLEKKKLAVVNPFSARPAPSSEDEAEAELWKAMKPGERSDAVKAELEAARKALVEAESALLSARRG